MLINPWKASKWTANKKKIRPRKQKLICPFCQKGHRSINSAHICALEVSKYGSVEMRSQFAMFEAEWHQRHQPE